MIVYKTIAGIGNSKGELDQIDTIEHEGQFWLVPSWSEMPELGVKKPDRIIPLAKLQHQPWMFQEVKYALTEPVPKDVFAGTASPERNKQYGVVEAPEISLTIPRGIH